MPEILPFRPATELAAEVRAGRIGAQDLLDLHIDRIDRYDGDLNAIDVRDLDRARALDLTAGPDRLEGDGWRLALLPACRSACRSSHRPITTGGRSALPS